MVRRKRNNQIQIVLLKHAATAATASAGRQKPHAKEKNLIDLTDDDIWRPQAAEKERRPFPSFLLIDQRSSRLDSV
jgi:hypothetical protein